MTSVDPLKGRLSGLLATIGAAPPTPDTDLELTSLQVVTLVDQIEQAFDVRLTSREITRKNFRSFATLAAMLALKVAP